MPGGGGFGTFLFFFSECNGFGHHVGSSKGYIYKRVIVAHYEIPFASQVKVVLALDFTIDDIE